MGRDKARGGGLHALNQRFLEEQWYYGDRCKLKMTEPDIWPGLRILIQGAACIIVTYSKSVWNKILYIQNHHGFKINFN